MVSVKDCVIVGYGSVGWWREGLTYHTSNTDVSLKILWVALWAVNVLFVHNDLPVTMT